MDVSGYRNSGELSDISINVENEQFNLHKFPLYVRSNYFKNLTSNENNQVTKLDLKDFPGGSKIFAVVADYCYNKDIRVNGENVIPVRLASEYLDMKSNNNNLTALADSVLYDLVYQARNKRDYKSILNYLNQAKEYPELAEKSELEKKLIEAFAENLNTFVRSSSIYDKVYDKTPSSYNRLHSLSLSPENMNTLNNLPLKWMNDLVRSLARQGLNNHLLSHIVQNYIDSNTGHDPSSFDLSKPLNLIGMASDILKVEKNLSKNLSDQDKNDNKSALVDIVSEIRDKEKPTNLIGMASDILKVENKLSELAKSSNDETGETSEENSKLDESIKLDSDESEAKPVSLINVASEVMEKNDEEAKQNNLINVTGEILDHEKPNNLIKVAGEILDKDETKPTNLIDVASEILSAPKQSTSAPQIAEIIASPLKKKPNKEDILKIIQSLTNTLNDLKIDPQFPLPWLLQYVNQLHELNADPEVKAAFNRWTWNAINDPKNSGVDLSGVKPEVMVQMAKDAGADESQDPSRLIDFVDRYIGDLDKEKALDANTFAALASSVPKEKRDSFDNLALALVDLLKRDPSISEEKRKELIDLIDFSKVNENTLEACKNSKQIPSDIILDAALALCKKLRKELDDAKSQLKTFDYKQRPALTSSLTTTKPTYSNDTHYSRPTAFNSYSTKYTSPVTSRNRSYEPRITTSNNNNNYQSSYDYQYYSAASSYVPSSYSSYSSTKLPALASSSFKASPSYDNNELDNCRNYNHHVHFLDDDLYLNTDLDENTSVHHEIYSDDNECHDYFHATYSYSKVY